MLVEAHNAQGKPRRKAAAMLAMLMALMMCMLLVPAQNAYAFEMVKCTARPNSPVGSDILGGTETRITWEAQAEPSEEIVAFTLDLPDGTEYSIPDNASKLTNYVRLTKLTGDDFMTREVPVADFSYNGKTLTVHLAEPIREKGAYRIRIELYEVVFPIAGGEMQIKGTYELADGTIHQVAGIPAINVKVTSPAEQLATHLEQQEWVQAWNSNTFLRLFLNPVILVKSFPIILGGFFMALGVVLVAFPLAVPLGLLLALMRMSKLGILRGIGSLYVNVIRGTPMFLQIYIAFLGLPLAGINIPNFPLGVIVLALNSAAYLCEIFRAGIQSIPKGQFEAARSLGMSGAKTMMFVIIPQTVRRVLPTMTNEFILLYKDTSLLAGVGFMEVVLYARTIVAATGSITPYIVAACFYLVITIPLAKLVGMLETKLAGNDGGGSARKVKGRKAKAAAGASATASAGIVEQKLEAPENARSDGVADMAVAPERFSSM